MSIKFLSSKDVTERIRFSRSWMYDAINRGEFPAPRKIGRSSRWLQTDIDKWLAHHAGIQSEVEQ